MADESLRIAIERILLPVVRGLLGPRVAREAVLGATTVAKPVFRIAPEEPTIPAFGWIMYLTAPDALYGYGAAWSPFGSGQTPCSDTGIWEMGESGLAQIANRLRGWPQHSVGAFKISVGSAVWKTASCTQRGPETIWADGAAVWPSSVGTTPFMAATRMTISGVDYWRGVAISNCSTVSSAVCRTVRVSNGLPYSNSITGFATGFSWSSARVISCAMSDDGRKVAFVCCKNVAVTADEAQDTYVLEGTFADDPYGGCALSLVEQWGIHDVSWSSEYSNPCGAAGVDNVSASGYYTRPFRVEYEGSTLKIWRIKVSATASKVGTKTVTLRGYPSGPSADYAVGGNAVHWVYDGYPGTGNWYGWGCQPHRLDWSYTKTLSLTLTVERDGVSVGSPIDVCTLTASNTTNGYIVDPDWQLNTSQAHPPSASTAGAIVSASGLCPNSNCSSYEGWFWPVDNGVCGYCLSESEPLPAWTSTWSEVWSPADVAPASAISVSASSLACGIMKRGSQTRASASSSTATRSGAYTAALVGSAGDQASCGVGLTPDRPAGTWNADGSSQVTASYALVDETHFRELLTKMSRRLGLDGANWNISATIATSGDPVWSARNSYSGSANGVTYSAAGFVRTQGASVSGIPAGSACASAVAWDSRVWCDSLGA